MAKLLSSAYAVEMSMDQSRNIEKAIGEQISAARKIRKYTQKKFAEVLTQHGLPVDASAVSRMEKGERALKISECILVAESLDIDMQVLLRGIQTPAQELKETRQFADFCMHDMGQSFADWLSQLLVVKWELESQPELIAEVSEEIKSHKDYLPWVASNLSKLSWTYEGDPGDSLILTRDQAEADELLQCVVAYTKSRILPDPELSND